MECTISGFVIHPDLVCPLLVLPCVIVPPHREMVTHLFIFSSFLHCLSPFLAFHNGVIDRAFALSPPWNCHLCLPSSHHPALCSLASSLHPPTMPPTCHCRALFSLPTWLLCCCYMSTSLSCCCYILVFNITLSLLNIT